MTRWEKLNRKAIEFRFDQEDVREIISKED
jgi:hypothetical protein